VQSWIFVIAGVARASTALNVPLTVQEAIYPGGSAGITRTNEPVCQGVPIPDSYQIPGNTVSSLGLVGASAGQFRVLGVWPDGYAKWIEVCGILPSLTAGVTASLTLTTSGSGNFGGGNLASGTSIITVNNTGGAISCGSPGATCWTIKAAGGYNVFDTVLVGASTLVAAGSSSGLVVTGPSNPTSYPANVTCGTGTGQSPCNLAYSSTNDPTSSCAIEKNGPVEAVVRCVGNLMDSSQHPYMQYTTRSYFYQGKSNVKITTILRNADYNTAATPSADCNLSAGSCHGGTFDLAYKGMLSYEMRLKFANPSAASSLNYTFATDTSTATGSLNASGGGDSAYLYQGQSQALAWSDCPYTSTCANLFTTDTGWTIAKNASATNTGTSTQYPTGWADISDAAGNGIETGVYQMAAYFPKSLEFNGGGTDVRIGLFPSENGNPAGGPGNGTFYEYQAWPAWSINDVFLEFHTSTPASLANEFLKFQHYLLMRAPVSWYNSTGVFPYPISTASDEDSYMSGLASQSNPPLSATKFCYGATTNCIPDYGTTSLLISQGYELNVYHYYVWSASGPHNQEEFRWSNLQVFLKRGYPGRYLDSAHFYRLQAEKVFPHSDGTSPTDSTVNGFTWRSRPPAGTTSAELDGFGYPLMGCAGNLPGYGCGYSANSTKSFTDWPDPLHAHWYGMTDYYFLSGDETIRESMTPRKDWYLNANTYQGKHYNNAAGGLGYVRSIGIEMISSARFSQYLAAIGDTDAPNVLAQGLQTYSDQVAPDLCVSGYPAGCTAPPVASYPAAGYDSPGTSKVRGTFWGPVSRGEGWCGTATSSAYLYRGNDMFQYSLLTEGIAALAAANPPGWTQSNYDYAKDLTYGIGQWATLEAFHDNGSSKWFDTPNNGTNSFNNGFPVGILYDVPQQCNAPGGLGGSAGTSYGHGPLVQFGGSGPIYDPYSLVAPAQGMWTLFYWLAQTNGTLNSNQQRQLMLAVDVVANQSLSQFNDAGQYQLSALINGILHPSGSALQDVPFTVAANGGGNYTLTFTPPAGTCTGAGCLRIKWSPLIIAPSSALLGYDPEVTQTFSLSPSQYMTWFGANTTNEPTPTPGLPQTFTISAGVSGLTAANFSVKAYAAGGSISNHSPSNLVLVSGNTQTGTAGQALANPLVVEVTDASGNAVSGVTVNFAVTAGGGSLSATQAITTAVGTASVVWTLGPNVGPNTVSATSGSLSGSPVAFTATGTAPTVVPAALVLVSGSGQAAAAGQALPNPLVVKVTDASGNPVSGVTVNFAVTAGGGSLSAAQATTTSTGTASVTWTLGVAGTNTVVATSGTLSGSPVTFSAVASSSTGQTGVSWVRQTRGTSWPGFNGYQTQWWDPVSHQTIHYGIPSNSTSIYSTDLFAYNDLTNAFTHISGTGVIADQCSFDTPTQPGERHPGWQMAIDTRRNRLWLFGGVNQSCSADYVSTNGTAVTWIGHGITETQFVPPSVNNSWAGGQYVINGVTYTIASVQDATHLTLTTSAGVQTNVSGQPAPPNQGTRTDMYYLSLNSNPATDTWTRMPIATAPINNDAAEALGYDPDDDVLFFFGSDIASQTKDNWVYCPTDLNPTPGVLTSRQSAAGCTSADNWAMITPTGLPIGVYFTGMVYDTVTKKFIQFGGQTGGGVPQNQTWAYDVPSRTWTQKCQGSCSPPPASGATTSQPAMVYNPNTNKILFHQSTGTGSPADWQYDPVADTWTMLTSTGQGPSGVDSDMAFDPLNNVLITWSYNNGYPDVWLGTFSNAAPAATLSACDLNGDGVVNSSDVQIAISQSLGTAPCTNAALTGDGSCNVVDVQRVINAALGGACRTGQ
jgi:hypothetical protein